MLDDHDRVVVMTMMMPIPVAVMDNNCFIRLGRRSIGDNQYERRERGK